jgi:hypothetical protein
VGVHGVAGRAQLPTVDLGVGLALGVGAGAGRFELRGTHLFAQAARFPGTSRGAVAIAAWNVAALGCAVLGRPSLRAVLCGGPELGVAAANGRDLIQRNAARQPWLALMAAPRIEWAITTQVRLHVGVELVAAVLRPQFAARDRVDAKVATGAGGLRAMIGLAGHFRPGSGISRVSADRRTRP